MIAILGGLGAALCWSVSVLCSSRSSRRSDPLVVVAWMMLVGLVITAPLAAAAGAPRAVPASAWAWLALSGAGNVAGLLVAYPAMRVGEVSLVAPVVSTEGAIAAVIALLAGEHVAVASLVTLAAIAIGVCVAAIPVAGQTAARRAAHPRVVGLAMVAAISFGISLYATGRAGAELPTAWVVLAARAVGTAALAVPLALARRLAIAPGTPWLLLASGVAEVVGFFSFTWGARHGIAVASILASQFAALSVLGAYLVFGERLGRRQLSGVIVVVAGVAVLSALRA